MSFADKVTTGTYSFVSLIVKIILSSLALTLSTPATAKTQFFVHLSFNSTFQLINAISSDLQKLELLEFHCYYLVWVEQLSPNNLALYSKDLKALVWAILALKLFSLPLE